MDGCIDPSREKFSEMMKMPDDGPIQMINLLRFRDEAAYDDGVKCSGAEAYKAYGKASAPIFERVGGKIVFSADPKLVLIGPETENWDKFFIAEYPSAAAFGEMIKDPEYQKAVKHRQAAVEDSRLIRLKPGVIGDNFGE